MFRLSSVTCDLAAAAQKEQLQPAHEMEREVFKILQVLLRKDRKNVLIVGDHGVGKTRLAHGVAMAGVKCASEGKPAGCRILELNYPALMTAPADVPGAVMSLVNFLKANPEVVLFVDGFCPLLEEPPEGPAPGNLLRAAIMSGEIPCMGTMTPWEYEAHAAEEALSGPRFEVVRLEPFSEEKTLSILGKTRPYFERHHGVQISDGALEAAVKMTRQYLPACHLPGKAVEVLDQACARYRLKAASLENYPEMVDSVSMRHLGAKVGAHDVKRVIMETTAVDIDADEAVAWASQLDARLKRHIAGQDAAVGRIAAAMAQIRLGFGRSGRPAGVMLFAGPPGTGKRHAVRCLSRHLLGSEEDLAVFDMANYPEAGALKNLFGVDENLDGDVTAGELGPARNAPFAIVAFTGIEKAPRSFFDILWRPVSSGVLKDARGHELGFRNCLLILTLNCGPGERGGAALERGFGFVPDAIMDRLDAVATFQDLDAEAMRLVLRMGLEELYRTLKPGGVGLRVQDAACGILLAAHENAAGLHDLLGRLVVKPALSLVEAGAAQRGGMIEIAEEGGRVIVRMVDRSSRENTGK